MSNSGSYLEYLKYYKEKLIKENGDKNEIQKIERMIEQAENPLKTRSNSQPDKNNFHSDTSYIDQSKAFRQEIKQQAQKVERKSIPEIKVNSKPVNKTRTNKKRKIKNKSITLKDLGIAVAIGACAGIPLSLFTYNAVKNMPTSLNYTTVEEKKKGLEHDDSNYRKYLEQKYHLSAEEIDKRIELEENNGRWGRIPDKEIGDD